MKEEKDKRETPEVQLSEVGERRKPGSNRCDPFWSQIIV